MTASRNPSDSSSLVTKVVDFEPPPVGVAACRSATSLRRRTPRALRRLSGAPVREALPPRAAVTFADGALRRVLEVIDRRRPVAQVRPLLAPAVVDTVIASTRASHAAAATLRRIRLRPVDDGATAAEVFGTYTRGSRVRAIAARVARTDGQWRIVALQLG